MLIKPFSFLGSQAGGGEATWDASLGDTLTINYWWDFTSQDYVDVNGSDEVTLVTPRNKPFGESGAATLTGLTSPWSFTNAPMWDSALNAITLENACLLSSSTNNNLNWVPVDSEQVANFTIVTIAANNNWQGNNNDAVVVSSMRNQDFDNLVTLSANQQKAGTSACSGSGDFVVGFAQYDNNWTEGRNQLMTSNPSGSAGYLPNMYTSYWDGANSGNNSKVTINNHEYCTFDLNPKGDSSTTRPGLVIGAAPGLSSTAAFSGSFFHHVMYSGSLTQTQTNDLYASWVDFYLN